MIATTVARRAKVPPSQRDFQVYRFVKVQHNSTRQAAGEFNISQSRVRQVIGAVVEYLVASVPVDDEGKCVERLQVAELLARDQLEYLYGQALEQWRRSAHDPRTGPTLPKTCFLSLATRITMCMSRVPVHVPPRMREDEEEGESEAVAQVSPGRIVNSVAENDAAGETPAPRATAGETPAPHEDAPSVEDCSQTAVSRANGQATGRCAVDGSSLSDEAYERLNQIKSQARRDFLRPAQAVVPADSEPLIGGGGDSLASAAIVTTGRPLNRKQRRARERRLKQALAKR